MAVDITEHEGIARWQDDLLPRIVDRLGNERPHGVYSMWATPGGKGLRTITYHELANAVNGLAGWLVARLGPGRGGVDPEVLTYIGSNDVRYVVLLMAAIKAGYVVFLTSPRNSLTAHRSLFEQLRCQTLLTSDPVPPHALAVINEVKPRHLAVPSVDELLEKEYPPLVSDKTFQEARWEPLLIIHTSGSTGAPKPVIYTHESFRRYVRCISPTDAGVPSLDDVCRGKRVISMLPLFHGAGIAQHIFNAIPFGTVPIAVGTAAIPTAQDIVDTLKQTACDVVIAVPSVVAELAQDPELLDFCATHIEMILYIGGALPQAIGDRVSAKVPLRCQWGASEVGIPQQLLPPGLAGPGDWSYVSFHPCVGAAFDEVADGGYELVFWRKEGLSDTQTIFSTRGNHAGLENWKEYRTKDLFAPHPTVPDVWRWCARADDIIVFLNGEKTNPVPMEQHVVAANPELSGAIVVGSQRVQAALLIEPASANALTVAEQATLIERVWPSVEEANRDAPFHARIAKSLILVTPADRPPIRAGKGTLQRASTVAQYATEIDRLYAQADELLDENEAVGAAGPTDAAGVKCIIREAVRVVTGWPTLEDTDSFFERGMDSLQALRLTRTVRRAFGRQDVALSTIYQNPTVRALEAVVLAKRIRAPGRDDGAESDRAEMEPMLATYRRLIQEIQVAKSAKTKRWAEDQRIDVVLTGSTGTVGTFLLHALLGRSDVGHIFCLNRSADAEAVQKGRFSDADANTLNFARRVSFLQADLAAPDFGLGVAAYETLRSRASVFIHNAWPVNFNLPLPAFRPQMSALVHIFTLAAAAPRRLRVLFVSSVSAVGAAAGPAPELVLTDPDAAYPTGYARAKFLAESLCDAGAAHLADSVAVAIGRAGQVAGPVRRSGLWNPAEWFPSLVRSSASLGCLPDSVGAAFDAVDFVPVDVLADVLVDLAMTETDLGVGARDGGQGEKEEGQQHAMVYNLRNPHPVPWAALLPAVADGLAAAPGTTKPIEVVPSANWLARLQEAAAAMEKNGDDPDATARRLPALKLLGFFQNLWATAGPAAEQGALPMAMERTLAASPALAALGPVEPAWMRKWVAEWLAVRS